MMETAVVLGPDISQAPDPPAVEYGMETAVVLGPNISQAPGPPAVEYGTAVEYGPDIKTRNVMFEDATCLGNYCLSRLRSLSSLQMIIPSLT